VTPVEDQSECAYRPKLSPAVEGVIATVLHESNKVSTSFFAHKRLGLVYRAYVISQVLDPRESAEDALASSGELPGEVAARILSSFGLAGPGSEEWVQLYQHLGGVVAAAVTIAKRMSLSPLTTRKIRSAALLHDATKRRDVDRHGPLANSLTNEGSDLADAMRAAGYSEETIASAGNTGRDDRAFDSADARWQSIVDKGLVAAVVALADTRSLGAEFCSLDQAQEQYLRKKEDQESQEFFTRHWRGYYEAVEVYLTSQAPSLDLDISNRQIYDETIFPEVFGVSATAADRLEYSFVE
jgi:hypothetical protein